MINSLLISLRFKIISEFLRDPKDTTKEYELI